MYVATSIGTLTDTVTEFYHSHHLLGLISTGVDQSSCSNIP